MILYVLEIKHKSGWKKLVRSKSIVFNYLSQMSKWNRIREKNIFNSFLILFKPSVKCDSNQKARDSNQVQILIRINSNRAKMEMWKKLSDSNQIKLRWPISACSESCVNSYSNQDVWKSLVCLYSIWCESRCSFNLNQTHKIIIFTVFKILWDFSFHLTWINNTHGSYFPYTCNWLNHHDQVQI